MRKVIAVGETVLDIIFKNQQPIGAYPGGSSFNAAISLGRAGIPATFIGDTGNDRVGHQTVAFLQDNGIDTSCISMPAERKSAVSLAFLNEHNDAEYLFYKDHEHASIDFVQPDIQPDDILLFGSFYAVNPVIRPQMSALLDYARSRGALIYYDVNFRSSHSNEVMKVTPNLIENLEYADVVRGSLDDFSVLYRKTDPESIYRSDIAFYCKNFICTKGAQGTHLFAGTNYQKTYDAPPCNVESTIGAGDNFNAGLLYAIIKYNITRQQLAQGLSPQQWDHLVDSAQTFAQACCATRYNYIPESFGNQMKQNLLK